MRKDSSKYIQVIDAVKEQFQKIIASKIDDIILYGSYARGDQKAGSDIDLLFILKKDITDEEKREINQKLSEISLQNDIVVSCNFYQKEDYTMRNTPFLLNIKNEGVRV